MDNEEINNLVNNFPFALNEQTVTFSSLPREMVIDFFIPGVESVFSQLDVSGTATIIIIQSPRANISLITLYSIIYIHILMYHPENGIETTTPDQHPTSLQKQV